MTFVGTNEGARRLDVASVRAHANSRPLALPSRLRRGLLPMGALAVTSTLASGLGGGGSSLGLVGITLGWWVALFLIARDLSSSVVVVAWGALTAAAALSVHQASAMLYVMFAATTIVVTPLSVGLSVVGGASAAIVVGQLVRAPSGAVLSGFLSNGVLVVGVGLALRSAIIERARADALASTLRRRNEELRASNEQIDALAASAERSRLARDLHDRLGHRLTTVSAFLRVLRDAPSDAALRQAQTAATQGMTELRACVGLLREPSQTSPLGAALHRLVGSLPEYPPVELRIEGSARNLGPKLEVALFRVVQEGLSNALQHAGASRLEVQLCYANDRVELTVRDDGGGADHVCEGMGLVGIRQRLSPFGGEVRFVGHGSLGGWETQVVVHPDDDED